jgi:hypothetical protein
MKLLKLTPPAQPPGLVLAARLMAAIGSGQFAARLLEALRPGLAVSHCTVFALRSDGRVEPISSASAIGEVATLTATEYIRLGFDRQDSNMVWLARRKPARKPQLWIGHQFAHEVADEAYRRLCYGEPGIRERLSLLVVLPSGDRLAMSLYRNHSYPDFQDADSQWLADHAPLFMAAVMQHTALARQGPGASEPAREMVKSLRPVSAN